MQLAGRLRFTTLGDVLGALYRDRVTGILELTECEGPFARGPYRIHVSQGLVREIEMSDGAPRFVDTRVPFNACADALEQQRARMEMLFRLKDARLIFRVADCRRPYRAIWPLSPKDFLHGRPRFRDHAREQNASRAAGFRAGAPEFPPRRCDPVRARALRTLGLPDGADATTVARAFRKLAARTHPDRFPQADEAQRAELMRRFAELSAAYHLLVA